MFNQREEFLQNQHQKKVATKGGKQPQKHLLHKLIRQNKSSTGGNQKTSQIPSWTISIKGDSKDINNQQIV